MEKIYELQANICKALSNPNRLEIINKLKEKELSAAELMEKTGLSKSRFSQYMGGLKATGLVLSRREGVTVYYRISNIKIIEACTLMREVLLAEIKGKSDLAANLKNDK
ncbi:MAG: metalloregulator ArsR/SmtB family transcription factor [Syntrophales bacterium]|jgi:ArsR family transcriptional regulator|nr:metalloregulator ArsR/SmtB family transcription factor [Syntrophales bacterium]